MKPSVYGQVRQIMKARFHSFGQTPTQETILEMVEGNRETVKRAYRFAKWEINNEIRITKQVAQSCGTVERIFERYRMEEFKFRAFVYASIAFSSGFIFGVLLITL